MTRVVRDVAELRAYTALTKRNRFSVGFVPTMGALHAGHRSLMRRSWAENDRTVVSIYVNPLQFLPGEDYERYPRQLPRDVELCEEEKVDVVFAPSVAEMQPPGRSTVVRVDGVSHDFEGRARPGHFDGVATIVASLLNLVQPDRAYFGQKDFQQTVVVRRMVRDLHVPSKIVVCPTLRDPDGLALSSRNAYLSAADREEGLRLSRSLRAVEKAVAAGETDVARLRAILVDGLASPRPDVKTDYADVVHPETLAALPRLEGHGVALAVLRVGAVRLLDNAVVAPPGTPAWGE